MKGWIMIHKIKSMYDNGNKITPEHCDYLNQLLKRPHLKTSMIRDHIYAFLAKLVKIFIKLTLYHKG
ncbi:MAG: hypothetical protein GY714_06130 [Desulfobacterales bacterium]|nr:hypothetical protein [Desulfobacterales bacterium]MCP4163872.1 hypothetical protein [Deltaproteobacteria bacterium]